MTFKTIIFSLAGLPVALLPLTAQAQSSDFDRAFAQQGTEARISFSIPFGNSSDKTKTAPRLNFGVRHYVEPSKVSADWMRQNRNDYRDVSLGFTFEETPKLMLNEQVLMPLNDEQANISTAGKIGLGIGAAVVVGVAVLAVVVATADFSEE